MFFLPKYVNDLRKEARKLRIYSQQLNRSIATQKKNNSELEDENSILKKDKNKLEEENKRLRDELEKAKVTINTYKKMLFDKHKQGEIEEAPQEVQKDKTAKEPETKDKKQNGQKKGHVGYGRKLPEIIDQQLVCSLANCPDCGNPLNQSNKYHSHVVTDIPSWKTMKPITTKYQIAYQWCTTCKKAVSKAPFGLIPGSRIGITLFLMILIWRYQLRLPFKKIAEILSLQYGISLSAGGIVGITKKAREYFGDRYEKILNEIRGAPVKHSDETTWGMDGLLFWCWILLSKKSVYYSIEDTRGKGVIEELLKDAIGILVRDGYAAYKSLPLIQQACLAHLYRKARDAALMKAASNEAKALFKEIQQFYGLLTEDIQRPFDKQEREELFKDYKEDLKKITSRNYRSEDAKRVQTYIKNLGDNILTALLHENVPLTNNAAEQAARQIVIGRKISGGSRSKEGAKTHAVNMSIIQTILKQKQPLFATLESYLLEQLSKSSLKN